MMNILNDIIKHKEQEVAESKKKKPLGGFINDLKPSGRDFKKAISKEGINLIAELKKMSPSAGVISRNFDIDKIIKIYNKYAAAISVLTDEKFFSGSLENLKKVRTLSKLPLLRKDFIIDEYQIYESRDAGADAILLIASILTEEQINDFIKIAKKYKMDCLVEIHNIKELKKVLKTDAEIIGINNRSLENFKIDLNTTLDLAQYIPTDRVVVSESGINDYGDVAQFGEMVNAVLAGTSLLKGDGIELNIKNLLFPRVKICGIKKLEHAKAAARYGADFLGFIFVRGRFKYIDPKEAKIIIQKARKDFPSVKMAGVFQDEELDTVNEIACFLNLDFVQLHGNESPSYCKNVIKPVIKAVGIGEKIRNKRQLKKIIDKYKNNVVCILFDAPQGGSGKIFAWHLVEGFSAGYPIILAGGLNSKNIKRAIKTVRPQIVDVSSGVEGKTKEKDNKKIKEFINLVKS